VMYTYGVLGVEAEGCPEMKMTEPPVPK
jgi:hypothetical protein